MKKQICPRSFSKVCRQKCDCCELVNGSTTFGVCENGLIRGQGGALRVGTFEEGTLALKGVDSTALGHNTQARGDNSLAVGLDSIALVPQSVALGTASLAYLPGSLALQSASDRENGDSQNLRFTSRGQPIQNNTVSFQIGTPGVPITLPFLGKAYVEVAIVGSLTTGGKVSFTVDNNGVAYTSTVPQLMSGTVTNAVILPGSNGFQLLVDAATELSGALETLTATFDITMVTRLTQLLGDQNDMSLSSTCGSTTSQFHVGVIGSLNNNGFKFGVKAFQTGTSTPAALISVSITTATNATLEYENRVDFSWVQVSLFLDNPFSNSNFTVTVVTNANTTVYFAAQLQKALGSDIYKTISCP